MYTSSMQNAVPETAKSNVINMYEWAEDHGKVIPTLSMRMRLLAMNRASYGMSENEQAPLPPANFITSIPSGLRNRLGL